MVPRSPRPPSRLIGRRGGWTLASLGLLLALFVLQQSLQTAPDAPGLLTPGLEGKLGSVQQVAIESGPERLLLCQRADGWRLCEQAAAPADRAAVRGLLLDLARIEIVRVRSRRPDRFAELGLHAGSPAVTLRDGQGGILLRLSIGDFVEGSPQSGRLSHRFGLEWRANAALELAGVPALETDLMHWATLRLPVFPPEAVTALSIAPRSGGAIGLIRRGDRFVRTDGGTTHEANADGLAATLGALAFDAIAFADDKPADLTLTATRKEGAVRVLAHRAGEDLWISLPDDPALSRYSFRLPAFQADVVARMPRAYELAP